MPSPTLIEIALFCTDVTECAKWFETLLGHTPAFSNTDVAEFIFSSLVIRIHRLAAPSPAPCETHIAFNVVDIAEYCRALNERGIQPEVSLRHYPWGQSAYFRAPNAFLIELTQTPPL